MIQNRDAEFTSGGRTFRCRFVHDDAVEGPRPGVLVIPAFFGLRAFEIEQAERLAALGYAALAVDYYGDGAVAGSMEEAAAWMGDLMADRADFLARMEGALAALKSAPEVDEAACAAIGYCLGGKAVLDLARSGADFAAGVSLHGVYDPPPTARRKIKASLLMLHGWDDPLATPADVNALAEELTETCEDWSLFAFGATGHAFTNPENAASGGMGYVQTSADRSWATLTAFLKERIG